MSTPGKLIVNERVSEFPAPAPTSESAMLVQAIARVSTDSNVDIAKMQALMQMYREINAQKALEAFGAAMAAAQAEMGPISADAMNPQTRSKYASYAQLDRALRPIYTKHGFAISFNEGETDKPGYVRIIAKVSHSAGHIESFKKDMPADGKGAKGGDVMTLTHATGAAQSYGMRYILKGIFNVAVGEEDKDGNDPPAPRITESQVLDLNTLIKDVGADKAKFLRYLKVNDLNEIRASSYATAVKMLKAKASKAKNNGT